MGMLAKFLKVLNSEASPWQIAIAITLGMIMGLTPLWRFHNLLLLLLILLLRINLASVLVSFLLFSAIAWIFDPWMNQLGETLLTATNLQPMWTSLFNTTTGKLSQLNHTLTLGSLLCGLILAPILLFASRFIVLQYRQRIMQWVSKLKVMQAFKASKLYYLYQQLGG